MKQFQTVYRISSASAYTRFWSGDRIVV